MKSLWIAVGEESILILNYDSMQSVVKTSLADIVTFGGYKENFFIVINQTDSTKSTSVTRKFVFRLFGGEAADLTHLIVDYINLTNRNSSLFAPENNPNRTSGALSLWS